MSRIIVLEQHNPKWSDMYHEEAKIIRSVLRFEVIVMYHIGSTVIPGIKAKPTIDILAEVRDISRIESYIDNLAEIGYETRREFGIKGGGYFVKSIGETDTHHLHIFEAGHPEVQRLLNFRDYMISHPKEARAYSQLKEKHAKRFETNPAAYTDGKEEFIRRIDKKAKEWIDAIRVIPQS